MIDPPIGTSASQIFGLHLNDAGGVLGTVSVQALPGQPTSNQSFLYADGSYTLLAVPGASSTTVRVTTVSGLVLPAINDAGQVIGSYADDAGSHAFLFNGSDYATLAVPGAASTIATEVNAAGQVLGTYDVAPGSAPGNTRSFVYSDGTYATIAVPGASSTTAEQINDAGQVAGVYNDATGTHVFLETDGNYVTVPPPDGAASGGGSQAAAPAATDGTAADGAALAAVIPPSVGGLVFFTQLSNAGDVLAYAPSAAGGPFVFSGGVSTPAGGPGAAGGNVSRINDLGQLLGTFSDGVNTRAFLATPLEGAVAADGSVPPDVGVAAAMLLPPTDNGLGAIIGLSDLGVP